ncbi:MAG: PorV/PorQ family protein [Bacteroidota bacterium]
MVAQPIRAQFTQVAFGDDFLSVGGGARPLAMGSAYTGISGDVTSAFWNVAGLADAQNFQVMYMHSERFNGVVGYDYGAVATPVDNGVVGLTIIRQGVDGIKNTLNAWDQERDIPKSNPTSYFSEFSASDYAFLFSYASSTSDFFNWGINAKIIHSKLGPFASAWGYSFDLGMLYKGDAYNVGINIRNISTLMKFWDVNTTTLKPLADSFDDEIPKGRNERTPPSVQIGLGRTRTWGEFEITSATDLNIRFDGTTEYAASLGNISFEPHWGLDVTWDKKVSIRGGVTDVVKDFNENWSLSPTMGAGLQFEGVHIDYGFASFSGVTADLGYTHRISLLVLL